MRPLCVLARIADCALTSLKCSYGSVYELAVNFNESCFVLNQCFAMSTGLELLGAAAISSLRLINEPSFKCRSSRTSASRLYLFVFGVTQT